MTNTTSMTTFATKRSFLPTTSHSTNKHSQGSVFITANCFLLLQGTVRLVVVRQLPVFAASEEEEDHTTRTKRRKGGGGYFSEDRFSPLLKKARSRRRTRTRQAA